MKSFRDVGIFYKLILIYLGTGFVLFSVAAFLLFEHEKKEFFRELENNGRLISESLATVAVLPLLAKDYDLMEDYLGGVLDIEPVVGSAVYLPDGKLFVEKNHSGGHSHGDFPELSGRQVVAFMTDDRKELETYLPIYAEEKGGSREEIGLADNVVFSAVGEKSLVGYVHVTLSASGLAERVSLLAGRIMAVAGILFLLSLAILIPVIRKFIGPVQTLSDGARRVAMGDLDVRVNVASSDEIGVMADVFNHMVENLKDMISEAEGRAREVEALFEGAMEGIFLLDDKCSFIRANSEMVRALAYEGDKLRGANLHEISDAGHDDVCEEVKNRGQALMKEISFQGRDGLKTPFEVSLTEVDYGGSRVVLGFARNIAARKRMEKQLLQSESLAATGRLAADIAHEVNNPLGIIKNYLAILKKEMKDPPDDVMDNLRVVGEEIDRIAGIITGLLTFSRYDVKAVKSTDINMIITQIVNLTKPAMKRRGIDVDLDLDPCLPEVRLSPDHLKQVIINLLNNAEDSMEDGGEILIKTINDSGGACIMVEDEGSGVAEEKIEYVFSPFFTTKGVKGTGLGLSVSYGIVKSYGGEIVLINRDDGGVTARVFFPGLREMNDEQ